MINSGLANNKNGYSSQSSNRPSSGVMNPLNVTHHTINLHMNSKFRDNYESTKSSSFIYTFQTPLNNIISMKLISIDMASSWFMVDDREITSTIEFRFKMTGVDEPIVRTIKINRGNYFREHMISMIVDAMSKSLEDINDMLFTFHVNEYNLECQFGFQFAENAPYEYIDICFWDEKYTLKQRTKTLGWKLGFRTSSFRIQPNDIKDDDDIIRIRSSALYDAGTDRYIYFEIDDFTNNCINSNYALLDMNVLSSNIIGKINVFEGSFGINLQEFSSTDNAKERMYHGPVDIKKLKFRILDEFGDLMNLYNMDFAFTLEVKQVYNAFTR